MSSDIHYRYTRDLPNTTLQVFIVSCHNVAPILFHSVDQTVICVCSFVGAVESLESWVFSQPKTLVFIQVTYFSASRYLVPIFSSSAMTQSVTQGTHLASRQLSMDWKMSSLYWIEKLMKLVSMIMW